MGNCVWDPRFHVEHTLNSMDAAPFGQHPEFTTVLQQDREDETHLPAVWKQTSLSRSHIQPSACIRHCRSAYAGTVVVTFGVDFVVVPDLLDAVFVTVTVASSAGPDEQPASSTAAAARAKPARKNKAIDIEPLDRWSYQEGPYEGKLIARHRHCGDERRARPS